MTSTTELLKDYAFTLRRLEYDADKPRSNMTLGEYEAEEKKITDEYSQAIAATLGNMDKSRWFELFGTPERAARTLEEFELDQINWCHGTDYCEKCPYEFDRYGCYPPDGFSLLEWLRGDAE